MEKDFGDEKPSLEELAHFGVIGMKWGIRRGGLGSRIRGGSAQALRDAEFRKARRRALVPGHTIPGYNAVSRYNQRKLDASRQRIERVKGRGKLHAIDILRAARYLTYADLLVTTAPKKNYLKTQPMTKK